ncbi:MAG: insulinase family protein [Marinoscillum sp.]
MKKILGTLSLILTFCELSAQNNLLQLERYQLDNGFTVFLNPDSTANKVFGAVIVNAGAKNEDPSATGMAHYLEHMLFKGTEVLGTWDFDREKPHLDSIRVLYDQLSTTKSAEAKLDIQKKINEQSVKGAEYALPNEFDKLLKSIGSTEVNAFTNYEMTFYHNFFPAHEINKWLDIYAQRFTKPVFRSFQSELEVVYEERNRAQDSYEVRVFEKAESLIYPNLPYGQWSVLGTTEHLKNPSLNKMYAFFEKNYVPGNMALILTGNFNAESVKPAIAENFGVFEAKPVPQVKLPEPKPFKGTQVEKVRITPIKAAFLGYQTVPYNHPDRYAMDVVEYLLYNEGETGYINQIQLNNEMIYAGTFNSVYNDAGSFVIFFVPKPIVQSVGNAEKKIQNALNQVKQGKFSDDLFKSAKNEISRQFQESLEDLEERGILIGGAFNTGIPWQTVLDYPKTIEDISREEVMAVANKYLGENHLKMISRTGFPKKDKLDKPPYKPVVTEQEKESAYVDQFENISSLPFEPKFLDFEKDVDRSSIGGKHQIITSVNPINDIYTLQIRFKKGTINNPKVEYAATLASLSGAGEYALNDLKQEFGKLGSSYSIYATLNDLVISVTGSEEYLTETLQLVNTLITDIKPDDNSKKVLVTGEKTERRLEKRTPSSMSSALFNYASYGENSYYLKRLSISELKKTDKEELKELFLSITTNYEAEIWYSGRLSANELATMLTSNLELSDLPKADAYDMRPLQSVSETKILFVNDKKAVQSQVYFYTDGPPISKEDFVDQQSFNQYFGGGFSGLVAQEIREYRSLAYSAGGWYQSSSEPGEKSRLITYIGCQADKTTEAVKVMKNLLEEMPAKADRIPLLRKSLQMEIVTEYPDFRTIPARVVALERLGYTEDPNVDAYPIYQDLEMEDIMDFYETRLKGKAFTITIYGDKRRIDLDELKKLGTVEVLDPKDFVKK